MVVLIDGGIDGVDGGINSSIEVGIDGGLMMHGGEAVQVMIFLVVVISHDSNKSYI